MLVCLRVCLNLAPSYSLTFCRLYGHRSCRLFGGSTCRWRRVRGAGGL